MGREKCLLSGLGRTVRKILEVWQAGEIEKYIFEAKVVLCVRYRGVHQGAGVGLRGVSLVSVVLRGRAPALEFLY